MNTRSEFSKSHEQNDVCHAINSTTKERNEGTGPIGEKPSPTGFGSRIFFEAKHLMFYKVDILRFRSGQRPFIKRCRMDPQTRHWDESF